MVVREVKAELASGEVGGGTVVEEEEEEGKVGGGREVLVKVEYMVREEWEREMVEVETAWGSVEVLVGWGLEALVQEAKEGGQAGRGGKGGVEGVEMEAIDQFARHKVIEDGHSVGRHRLRTKPS